MASALAASPSVKVSAEGPGKGVGSGSERETRRWRGIRRAPNHHPSPSSSASIPSRYQTFFCSSSDVKGFSSQSPRFPGNLGVNENPGPGTYCYHTSSLHTHPQSSSVSGSGGFASKTQRFRRQKKEALGPGSYHRESDPNRSGFTSSNVNSFFQKPIANQTERTRCHTSPSPTTYTPSHTHTTADHLITAQAVFKSSSKRYSFPSSSAPSPSHYSIRDRLLHPSPPPYSSVFKSASQREGLGRLVKGPGPSDYSPFPLSPPHHSTKLHPPSKRKHYLCMSAPAFPLAPFPPSPGPGHYETQTPYQFPKQEAAGSMFVSKTSRWSSEVDGNHGNKLGPGSYNPVLQERKSYIYNLQGNWI